jgi:hypothetical protein
MRKRGLSVIKEIQQLQRLLQSTTKARGWEESSCGGDQRLAKEKDSHAQGVWNDIRAQPSANIKREKTKESDEATEGVRLGLPSLTNLSLCRPTSGSIDPRYGGLCGKFIPRTFLLGAGVLSPGFIRLNISDVGWYKVRLCKQGQRLDITRKSIPGIDLTMCGQGYTRETPYIF